jgi:hypothetical protein
MTEEEEVDVFMTLVGMRGERPLLTLVFKWCESGMDVDDCEFFTVFTFVSDRERSFL